MRCLQLPEGREIWLRQHADVCHPLQLQHANADDTNSAVEVYLQAGTDGRPVSQPMTGDMSARMMYVSRSSGSGTSRPNALGS